MRATAAPRAARERTNRGGGSATRAGVRPRRPAARRNARSGGGGWGSPGASGGWHRWERQGPSPIVGPMSDTLTTPARPRQPATPADTELSVASLVENTPASRDRYVDFLRAL